MHRDSDNADATGRERICAHVAPDQQREDARFMDQALLLARQAGEQGEVPVGSVVTLNGHVLGKGMNQCVMNHDPSAHAEVMALRDAAQREGSFRLDGATLYVTLEPCLMCCGALLQARIARLVFAARQPQTGAVVSIHEALRLPGVDHHVAISEGIRAEEGVALLGIFFARLR